MKSIKVVFKSGAVVNVPYSAKFYKDLTENIGKDHVSEHPSATIQTKEVQAVVYENIVVAEAEAE